MVKLNYEEVLVENVSKAEAYEVFHRVRRTVTDCSRTVIVVSGNPKNVDNGWRTVKIIINRFR